jgi:predicted ATPase
VRGYTRFTFESGDEAAADLTDRFADLTERVVARHAGEVVELRGDEALATFTSARAALRAALELQSQYADERRRTGLPLNVGIGLDTGEAVPIRGGYRGTPLNLAARLCSLAGPGDILASRALTQIARNLEGYSYLDRGEVKLKGFPEPIQVIQVVPEGGVAIDRPPLQQRLVAHPNNLPIEPTPFIGRTRELDDVLSLIHRPTARLVTLTGTGGAGKTRLALQAAGILLDEFPDGVFFVSLAAISDAALVMPTVAQTLDVPEETGAPIEAVLDARLRDRKLLLVLDNFEQVREAAPALSTLLGSCPSLRVIVTSRAVLNLYGEYVYDVPPLSVPDPAHLPDPTAFFQYESVVLFVERARAVKATFEVTAENAPSIAEICYRLDGLPLALELAAARIRLLPPRALAARLESRLSVLTGGFRGRPERQQTLRGTIDWSYGLLDAAEQTLFARLSVFVGGCTLDAIEAVCNADGTLEIDVFDGVAILVENSLLREAGDNEPRFVMLETIREYALSELQNQGIAAAMRDAHAGYFLALGETAEPKLRAAEQGEWLRRLDAEHDNLRAALARFLEAGEIDSGLRLAGALWRFWWGRGYLAEGRTWLERLLRPDQGSPEVRATALNGLANMVWSQGDLDRAEALHRQALELRNEVGDAPGIARSLNNLGLVNEQRGNVEEAAGWYERALSVARDSGDLWAVALVLGNLGGVMGLQGREDRAYELENESLRIWRELGDRASEGRVLNTQVDRALEAGDFHRAARLQRESLELYRQLGNQEPVAHCIEGAAKILARTGSTETAVQFWGAAEALRRSLGQPIPRDNHLERDRSLESARASIGAEAVEAAWSVGLLITADEAVEQALRELAGL